MSVTTPFEVLAGSRYVRLTTFRRTGVPVSAPVWVVPIDGELWIWTAPDAGKVKRLRHTARVEVAPCRIRGETLGAPVPATGRVVPDDQARRVVGVLIAKYGWPARMTFLPDRLGRLVGRPRPVAALAVRLS